MQDEDPARSKEDSMFSLGPTELLIILFIVLFVFGAGKVPDISRGIAKSIREFRGNVAENKPDA